MDYLLKWFFFKRIAIVVGALFFVIASIETKAQTSLANSQNDRLERLERDIRSLNIRISNTVFDRSGLVDINKVNAAPATARLGARIDRLEEDIRTTTGTLEEINHRITQIGNRIEKLVRDVDFRLSSMESQRRMSEGSVSLPLSEKKGLLENNKSSVIDNDIGSLGKVSVSEIEAIEKRKTLQSGEYKSQEQLLSSSLVEEKLHKGTPKEQYKKAFDLLQESKYDLAEIELKAFINFNKNNPLAENARYWLGEIFYVRKAYKKAAQAFFEGFQESPKGSKAADSLLKLGMSLSRLGKKQDACAAFAKLDMDFNRAPDRIRKALSRESAINDCS